MSASESRVEIDVAELLQEKFNESNSSIAFVNPSKDFLETLTTTAIEFDGEPPELQVLAAEPVLKTVVNDFISASRLADLITDETLALRTAAQIPRNSFLVTPNQIIMLLQVEEQVQAAATDEKDLVETANQGISEEWKKADQFTLRTPPYSRILETLDEEIGTEMKEDFATVINSADTVGDGEDVMDEVELSLLVAAKNEELLYEISRWGEDTGVASRATFSRSKTMLESQGLIETEKVPIDIGRPRLRLQLGTEDLQNVDAEEFSDRVQDLLG